MLNHHLCTSIEPFSNFSTIGWCSENFAMISLMVQELSCWQTDKHTNRHYWKQYHPRCAAGGKYILVFKWMHSCATLLTRQTKQPCLQIATRSEWWNTYGTQLRVDLCYGSDRSPDQLGSPSPTCWKLSSDNRAGLEDRWLSMLPACYSLNITTAVSN